MDTNRVERSPDDHTDRGICHLNNSNYRPFLGFEGSEVKVEIESDLVANFDDKNPRFETIKTSLDRAARLINRRIEGRVLTAEQYQDLCLRLRRKFSQGVAQVLAGIVYQELQKELAYCLNGTRKTLGLTLRIDKYRMVTPWWYVVDKK